MKNRRITETEYLGYWLRPFLIEYLIVTRNLSRNTQMSYRDTFRMLVSYVSTLISIAIDNLKISDITTDVITKFLDYLEIERKVSVSSRNNRLAAIKAFAKFLAWKSPEHIDWCHHVTLIPSKKTEKRMITYMDKSEIEALADAPLKTCKYQGIRSRDHVIILFMYNTGARVSEVIGVKVKDVAMPSKRGMPMVTLHGKGRKERNCPLWEDFWDLLKPFIDNKLPDDYLFLNRYNQPMSRFCIYEMIKKYSQDVILNHPSLANKRPSPHVIRHTTATHLLNSGADIDMVRNWMGHSSIDTTNIYAEISMERKLEVLKKCEQSVSDAPSRKWSEGERDDDAASGNRKAELPTVCWQLRYYSFCSKSPVSHSRETPRTRAKMASS